nr:NAD(P)/FAD-dependent oxidoreductase [Sulfobacillus harzensis]
MFGLYCTGLHHLKSTMIERLDRVGGQLEYLYPDKPIYDVGGFPVVTGRELVARLKQQAFQYPAQCWTGVEAQGLEPISGGWEIRTSQGPVKTRTVIITGGIGKFIPRRYNNPAIDQFEGRGLTYIVDRLEDFRGKRVLVVGGGDSAADWALATAEIAAAVTMIHRRDTFQCHADSLEKLQHHPRVHLIPNRTLDRVHGRAGVEAAELAAPDGRHETLKVDGIIVAIGLLPGTDVFHGWGLAMDGSEIRVASNMATNLEGVFAAGDVATYDGKVKLIAAGFGEVATAVEAALGHIAKFSSGNHGQAS